MRFVLSLATILVLLGVTLSPVDAQGKTCHFKEIDLCVTNFVYDQKGVPVNDRQFKKACSGWKNLQKCTNTFLKRCSREPLRETLEILMSGVVTSFNEMCAKPAGDPVRQELFKHGKCLNANQAKIQTCRDSTKLAVFYMLDQSYDKQFGILCCNARFVTDCTYKKTVELCGKEAGDFQKNYYAMTEDIVNICKHYDPATSSCDGLMVPENYQTKVDQKSALYRMVNAFL